MTKDHVKVRKVKAKYEFDLTRDEVFDKSMEANKLFHAVNAKSIEFDKVKKIWSSEIKVMNAEFAVLNKAIESKKEWREVEVNEHYDYDKKEVTAWYKGKVINKRPMAPHEHQIFMQELEEANIKKIDKESKERTKADKKVAAAVGAAFVKKRKKATTTIDEEKAHLKTKAVQKEMSSEVSTTR